MLRVRRPPRSRVSRWLRSVRGPTSEWDPADYRTRPVGSRWISSQNGLNEVRRRRNVGGALSVGGGINSSRWMGSGV